MSDDAIVRRFITFFNLPIDDREARMKQLLAELGHNTPGVVEEISGWKRAGLILWELFRYAQRAVLERPDLSDDEKKQAIADARGFVGRFGTVFNSPDDLCPTALTLDLAFAALFVGLNAGLQPGEITKLRQEAFLERQRELVKRGGKKNKDNRVLLPRVREIAISSCSERTFPSNNKLAEHIIVVLQTEGKGCHSVRTISKYLQEFNEEGVIQVLRKSRKGAGTLRKSPGSG